MPASDFHESDLEEIFNMSLDMICVADINTATFTKVNPAFMNTLGYSEEELLGKPFLTFIHPDDVKPTIDVINEKLKQGEKVINFENRYRCKDGSYRWLDWTSHPVPERGITFAIAHDITELKRATEAEYQTILHTSMDGFWIVDVKGRFLDVNEAYCSLTGYSRDELLGMKIPDVEAVESPEEVKIHAEKGIKDGLDRFETKHRCKDGSVKDLEVSVTYHDSKGGRFVAFARDITERKRAEENLAAEKERLAVTLRSIGDGVITTDTYGIVKLMNRVAEELTGWKQEEAIEKPLREVFNIVNEITGVPCESPVEKVIATGSVVGLANHTVLISRDGRRRILADSGAPIRDRQCVVIGVVLVFRDVTQQRIMEEEIQKHQKIESLGILAGGIAHDFNNILTAILGNVSLAKIQRGVGEAVREKLAEAEKAVERAKGLTQQLLTFAKGGAPVKKVIALKNLVMDSTGFALRGSNVGCEFDIQDGLWNVEADEGQIGQVIHNIVLNADQAMPEGGIVKVIARNIMIPEDALTHLPDGKYVRISFRDGGIGILPEHINKIFDPYFTTKKKGSGLGLTTSFSIVGNHGGLITAESRIGAGSTFHVFLPAVETAAVGEERAEEVVRGWGRILLMDDEPDVRSAAAGILKDLGYEVVETSNGEEALESFRAAAAENRPFDLAILDLTIKGGMGGRETIKILRKKYPNVRAIVASGYSNDPVLANFRDYGFNGIAMKPFSLADFSRTVAKVIKIRGQSP